MTLSFTEDLDAFFDTPGFTVPVVFGATTSVGYFESPNEITSDFSAVTRGDTVTVEGADYTVREPMLLDDGKIMRIMLMKD